MLVRALANISLCHVPGHGVLFTTMERGNYLVPEGPELAAQVVERLEPLATSTLVIDNEFRMTSSPSSGTGTSTRARSREVGKRLDALGLLPAPFPVEESRQRGRSSPHQAALRDRRPLVRNLSQRKDADRFWMSASGVDKAKLREPARDILLVSGYDAARGQIVLSVRPDLDRAASRSTRSSTG